MFHSTDRIERGERFRASLIHLSLPLILVTGAQYQNQWWLYLLLLMMPILLMMIGRNHTVSGEYPITHAAHHARRAIGFTMNMSLVALGLIYVLTSLTNTPSHQEQIVRGLFVQEDALFWFIRLMLQYGEVATHPFFPIAQMVLVIWIFIGLLCPLRSAISAFRGQLTTF